MDRLKELAQKYNSGEIDGFYLAELMKNAELSKAERRKIIKLTQDLKVERTQSARQLLRLETKLKKSLPKLSKEGRATKYRERLEEERQLQLEKHITCLGCRQKGHSLKRCPNVKVAAVDQSKKASMNICFNCGSMEHTLKNCDQARDPAGKLKFASCFICHETGHLSRDCPKNHTGLYPKGGGCHICGQNTHLVKDCPKKPVEESTDNLRDSTHDGVRINGLVVAGNVQIGGDDITEYELEVEESDKEEETDLKRKRNKRSNGVRKKRN